MKHISLRLALAALLTGAAVTASAANPFSDVKPTDWSYQAVEKLSAEGVVEGYPDGTFKGDKPITRYEMSQIVAKLMAKEGSLSADQKASVEKLSSEYADELKNLGVRVSELEKKVSDTQVILNLRLHYQPVYDNIYTGEKKDLFGSRLRINTITRVNSNVYLYGQTETRFSLNGTEYHDPYDWSKKEDNLNLTRLFTTIHFGEGDGNNQGFGPSKDIIAIGQFPVTMGVTGYTYDGTVKGVMAQFGDAKKGGKFTVAYGNASDINYAYTSPMMSGIKGFQQMVAADVGNKVNQLLPGMGMGAQIEQLISSAGSPSELKTSIDATMTKLQGLVESGKLDGDKLADIKEFIDTNMARVSEFADKIDWGPNNGTLYPLKPDVHMADGADEDVPVAYASYIYKNPDKYELHLYGMRAVGPVGHIVRAYGVAASYNFTDKWNVHGEYVKNTVKLPLNNERPYGFNYGIQYGKADVLQEKSFSLGVDYVYSQAGTYFGGSSNEIADQYMGHVYNNWHGSGQRMPAYIGDYLDAVMRGDDTSKMKFGGAKFFLAKAQYVPKKGLILEADYGFGAKDMGNRKMDNQFRFLATMYYK